MEWVLLLSRISRVRHRKFGDSVSQSTWAAYSPHLHQGGREALSTPPPTPHPAPAPSVLSWNVLEKVLALTTSLGPANRSQPLLSVLGPCR